jgi:deoxyribonuclease V
MGLRPRRRQRWRLTPRQAIALQQRLSKRLVVRGGPRSPKLIAGADVAYSPELKRCFGAAVVLRAPGLELVDTATAERETSFPYVPGLLSFREGPAVLAALAKLNVRPDLIMFDGHGLAHPRRFGLASHLGYLLGIPSIGCAKSVLVGEHGPLERAAGSFAWLTDKGEKVGAALRTRSGVRPVYVSPGHRVGLRATVKLALLAGGGFRVPEPTRLADILVERLKREALAKAYSRRQGGGNSAVLRKRT